MGFFASANRDRGLKGWTEKQRTMHPNKAIALSSLGLAAEFGSQVVLSEGFEEFLVIGGTSQTL